MDIKLHHAALIIEFNDTLNESTHQIGLTRSEYFILFKLFEAKGNHLDKETLKNAGWPDSYVCDNALTMSIMNLRKKLKIHSHIVKIKTIQRVGYSLYLATDGVMINVTY
jgi:DNA-binding winged helix-turn-helix (wHTH) protein